MGFTTRPTNNSFVIGSERDVAVNSLIIVLDVEEGGTSLTDYVRFLSVIGPLFALKTFFKRDVEVIVEAR